MSDTDWQTKIRNKISSCIYGLYYYELPERNINTERDMVNSIMEAILPLQQELIAAAEREAKPRTWWVTNHDTNTKVAGPFTTSDDAAVCREQLEKRESHHNYWIQQEGQQ